MAVNGQFTFEDLYAGQLPDHYRQHFPAVSTSVPTNSILSILNIPITTPAVPSTYTAKLFISTDVESNTKFNQLPNVIPFTYFYWILVVLAVLLIIILVIVFICYCRTFVKNYRARRESLSSFYRRRTINSRVYTSNIYQPPTKQVAPPSPPPPRMLPTPPCPSISLKYLDDELHRQDSDSTHSPPVVRHDVFLKEPLSTFSNSTSNLSSLLPTRLSTCSSNPPFKTERAYESQRASMVLNDEPKNDSLITDIH